MKRFEITPIVIYKNKYLKFGIRHNQPCLKEKWATQTEHGHWRLEIGESVVIFFMFWEIWIRFDNGYWDNWCDKKNKEER